MRAWPLPVTLALSSSLVSAGSVAFALHAFPLADEQSAHDRSSMQTPERVAESFVAAYTESDFERASHFTNGDLARQLRARARKRRLGALGERTPQRNLLIEESFFLNRGRLRLTGIAAREDAGVNDDWPVSLVVDREGDRYVVEELSWPKGSPTDPL